MRFALALVAAVATPAFADEPAPPMPPAPEPAPASEPPPPADPQPKLDPAYGGRPQSTGAAKPYAPAPTSKSYVVKLVPDRSRTNMIGLGAAAGAGVLLSAVGVYFHLNARSLSNDVGSKTFTGEAWTDGHQQKYDDAHSSAITAGVFYGLGGALLVGAAVAYIVTEPDTEERVITPHVSPVKGGATLGGTWRF